jgi:hypothetical protein
MKIQMRSTSMLNSVENAINTREIIKPITKSAEASPDLNRFKDNRQACKYTTDKGTPTPIRNRIKFARLI